MAQRLERVFANPGVDGPTDVLSLLGSHLLEDDDPLSSGLFLEAVVAARHEPELAEMLARALEGERTRLSKVIDEAKGEGLFDPALDTPAVLTFIQAIGLGFTIFRTNQTPMPHPDDWQVVIDRVISAALPPQETPNP
ncbi:MAG: TetR family transcriptional regulator C-terminal domain-containing protein [Acidimicrobiales bacterium]